MFQQRVFLGVMQAAMSCLIGHCLLLSPAVFLHCATRGVRADYEVGATLGAVQCSWPALLRSAVCYTVCTAV